MIGNICVVGAGTMGHGIAGVFAMAGCKVSLYEAFDAVRAGVMEQIEEELAQLTRCGYIPAEQAAAALNNIRLFDDLRQAASDAEFVIEAIPEDVALKQALFAQLDAICPADTIFATNTSSLPLDTIIAGLPEARKARCMVCHWYNPPHLIPIAELSFFGNMDEACFDAVYALHARAGKRPIKVLKDIPGLVANRILHAMAREVFHLIEIGAASAEDIDNALKFGPGFRAAAAGILETADMGGLDVWCTVQDNLFKALDRSDAACDLLRAKVQDGKLGVKTGEGFFGYPGDKKREAKDAFNRRLLTQFMTSRQYE